MSQPPDGTTPTNPFDPFGLWKQSQQAMLESWSKSMNEAVNTDAYAETTGRMLDTYLTVSAPLRKIVEQTMTQLLNQLSLPSRGEVVSIAERMTNIELRLDDLDARLDDIQRSMERVASAVTALSALAVSTLPGASANAQIPDETGTPAQTPASRRSARASDTTTARTTRPARAPRTTRGATRNSSSRRRSTAE